MLTIVYPGSFDPPTMGHENILSRCASLFASVHIVIASNPRKKYSFTDAERLRMMECLAGSYTNVSVHVWDGLIVDFAKKVDARLMVRGVRALGDFDYEFELSLLNKGLDATIETVFLPADPQYFVLRSSSIKELARYGGDISKMVPACLHDQIRSRLFNPS